MTQKANIAEKGSGSNRAFLFCFSCQSSTTTL